MKKVVDANIKIDGVKFRELVMKKGMTPAGVARKIGRGDAYLNRKIRQGYFNKSDILIIEAVFGIKLDDYVWKEDGYENEEVEPKREQNIDYVKLGKVIFDSVYAAMISADKAIRESR